MLIYMYLSISIYIYIYMLTTWQGHSKSHFWDCVLCQLPGNYHWSVCQGMWFLSVWCGNPFRLKTLSPSFLANASVPDLIQTTDYKAQGSKFRQNVLPHSLKMAVSNVLCHLVDSYCSKSVRLLSPNPDRPVCTHNPRASPLILRLLVIWIQNHKLIMYCYT